MFFFCVGRRAVNTFGKGRGGCQRVDGYLAGTLNSLFACKTDLEVSICPNLARISIGFHHLEK